MRALLSASRYVMGVAVIATLLGSVLLLLLSGVAVIRAIWEEAANFSLQRHTAHHVDHLGVQFIEITDTILLGTVLYIVSLGLYQLFIDQEIEVPGWLRVRNLTELKRDLVGVIVVLLGVSFLGEVADWDGASPEAGAILALGAAISLVAAALGLFLWITLREEGPSRAEVERTPPLEPPD